ncbi:MAG: HAD-IIB family hydrolase [Muribaculaceae bacterium]
MNSNSPISTLYVSDLDGTLLNEHSQVSAESAALLNEAIARYGAQFTCATARTPATIVPLLQHIHTSLPMIAMAGAAMWNPIRNDYENVRTIGENEIRQIVDIYERHGARPFVYRHCGGIIEAYHSNELSVPESEFVAPRSHTPLKRFVLGNGYGPCEHEAMIVFSIDRYSLLKQVYTDIVAEVNCSPVCYHDIFDPTMGILEVYSQGTSKATAIRTLAQQTGANRIVVFGDNRNDLPMMQIADCSVAVENAFPEVKQAADVVIGPNTANSVAEWVLNDAKANHHG